MAGWSVAFNPKGKSKTEMERLRREDAIKRRLDRENQKARLGAKTKGTNISPGKSKFKPTKYKEQYIKGEKEGFTKSDYGAEKGAAIPYQIGTTTKTYTGNPRSTANRPTMPNKPPAKAVRSTGIVKPGTSRTS